MSEPRRVMDAGRLTRAIASRRRRGLPVDRLERRLAALETATASRELRTAALDKLAPITYPAELPISAHASEIEALLREHQVVIVAGETGSGKTTQLPKLCLAMGFGRAGQIAHTQPRRLAARSVAARIAEEVGSQLGEAVGYAVRFGEAVGPETAVKIMTDGLLLAEISHDPDLSKYEVIIVDEAHERSLNIDFLLGYLARLLPRRPDLRLIVTSATIDVDAFARHFGGAPIVTIAGRAYPVEVVYLPPQEADRDDDGTPRQSAIARAIDCIEAERHGKSAARDVLVFLPGERDILECARFLRRRYPHLEVLPLYARLPAGEQARAFRPGPRRRIVLATNVAETSITVPNIGYVIDTGLARVSRYSARSRIERLPLEPIARANAEQRKGRCGRIAPGICYRLYDEADFEARPAFLEPEIQRSNLASVVLQTHALGLGTLDELPFMDPPEGSAVRDAERALLELGALETGRLTEYGRIMARLPIDPNLARMLIEAKRLGVLADALIVVAALAVDDPRERPLELAAKADAAHEAFRSEHSDFVAYLNLWHWFEAARQEQSQSRLRRTCARAFISFSRMREWRDVHRQLVLAVRGLGWRIGVPGDDHAGLHRALLPGLLRNLGQHHEGREYIGAHGRRFLPFPGSGLGKRTPRWLMAAEIVETSRVYARCITAVSPEWIEQAAPHLLRRSYSDPAWNPRRGEVRANERVTLFGLTIVERRRVSFTRIDPRSARELMLRDGLVTGNFATRGKFLAHNLRLIEAVREREARLRRRDLLVDEDDLFDFYDARVPADIADAASFERWRREVERTDPKCLFMAPADVERREARPTETDFPSRLELDGVTFDVKYRFAPGEADDGVTLVVPIGLLGHLRPHWLPWLVPGMLEAVVEALLRGLPKAKRRHLVPLAEVLPGIMAALGKRAHERDGLLAVELAEALGRLSSAPVAASDFDLAALPDALRFNIRVQDARGRMLAQGRDLEALQRELRTELEDRTASRRERFERQGLLEWPEDDVPERLVLDADGREMMAWPALRDDGGSVARVLCADAAEAARTHRAGTRRLLLAALGRRGRRIAKALPDLSRLEVLFAAVPHDGGLGEAILLAAIDDLAELAARPLRRSSEFEAALAVLERRLEPHARALAALSREVLEGRHALMVAIEAANSPAFAPALDDLRTWCATTLGGDLLLATPARWRSRLPVYVEAARYRLAHLQGNVERDRANMASVARWQGRLAAVPAAERADPELVEFRWLLEELRVALFAQRLGTREPVSERRLERRWEAICRRLGLGN